MSNIGGRNMAMNNPNRCPWQGPGRNFYNRMGEQQHPVFFPGQPRPPFPYNFNMVPPYPYQAGFNWQGPGPARPRGRSGRSYRGARRSNQNNQDREDAMKDVCCKCGERLQNSDELGVHLCDGGNEVLIQAVSEESGDELEGAAAAEADEPEKDLDARLEKLLTNLKDFVRSKYETVTDALEGYVTEKIEEITTLHRENSEEKEVLEKLKKELEEKSAVLLKEEKELRDKQQRLGRDKEAFQKEMVREKEEVCRKWQALRDEITRMEEVHKTQQGRIKLDVGGHVFTTSLLTLTREQDSMLAAMFSGRHEINKEEDGCVFIDRDGTHFRYVLNYLRDGGVGMDCLPRDRQLLRELRKEATYYQLHGLLHQIERCL